jgi:hypothetical protein
MADHGAKVTLGEESITLTASRLEQLMQAIGALYAYNGDLI